MAEVWRISAKARPGMVPPPLELQGFGRFDIPSVSDRPGDRVLYCAETAYASCIEVLSQFRRLPDLPKQAESSLVVDLVEREQYREIAQQSAGEVPEDWSRDWHLTHANVRMDNELLDLADASVVQMLRQEMLFGLMLLDLDDLDFGVVLGRDRQVTQGISRWAWSRKDGNGNPAYAGIRFRSRFDPEAICYALYADRFSVMGDVESIPISATTPGLAAALATLNLRFGS